MLKGDLHGLAFVVIHQLIKVSMKDRPDLEFKKILVVTLSSVGEDMYYSKQGQNTKEHHIFPDFFTVSLHRPL